MIQGKKRQVNLIAAVGQRGQIGLLGELPWRDPDDLRWFRQLTMGGIVIVGWKTAQTLPELPGRQVLVHDRGASPKAYLDAFDHNLEDRQIWVAGGAKTYEVWMPHVTRFFISRVDYDGPADAWMPALPLSRS